MKKRFIAAVITSLTLFCSCSCSAAAETENFLKITVLKIGKADAILLNTPSSAVLIDAGEDDDGAEILEKAGARGIEKFDYMILTHYDKDHVGGAAEVIRGIEIGEIIEPGYDKDSGAYNAYVAAADQAGIKRTVPAGDLSFELDGVRLAILTPQKTSYADENDHSLVLKAEYAGSSALFTGDALDERMDELIKAGGLTANILKAPHHGSFERKSEDFFAAVDPQYTIITCSDKNPPDEETVSLLEQQGSGVLLTSNGDIEVIFTAGGIEVLQ